jgi:hypothetical protein
VLRAAVACAHLEYVLARDLETFALCPVPQLVELVGGLLLGLGEPAPDRACGHGSNVNMRSHIYLRTGRIGVLVITVGEPEAFVKRRERIFTVRFQVAAAPLPLQLPEHTGDLVSGNVGQRPVGVELGEQQAEYAGAARRLFWSARQGRTGRHRRRLDRGGARLTQCPHLRCHRSSLAALVSPPLDGGRGAGVRADRPWLVALVVHDAYRAALRPGATQGLADAQPSLAENHDQGAVTDSSGVRWPEHAAISAAASACEHLGPHSAWQR